MRERVPVATVGELQEKGCVTVKIGARPVCVLWCDGQAYAVDDRCPHMGFPLHRGTAENGLLTCHWHNARFDLESGGTLDPFADDVRVYPVELAGGEVVVVVDEQTDGAAHHLHRLHEGLEQGLSLVMAKAVLGLFDTLGADQAVTAVVDAAVDFGVRYRQAGWGAGLTVLTAMAGVLPVLHPEDRALALVHGLSYVSRDTRGEPPRFALEPLTAPLSPHRLESWYRRFVDTRSGDAAERTLASAVTAGLTPGQVGAIMGAAATDHVFIDGGHTIDFINKAFEALDLLGWERAPSVLPTLAHQTAGASRSEEGGAWRHPHDLAALLARVNRDLPSRMETATAARAFGGDDDVDALAWAVLGDDPGDVVAALDRAVDLGATAEELARAVAYAAALRLTRFHTQNDHGDWDVVHHAFTTANAVHQLLTRVTTPEMVRGVYQGALRVFLDRFLNVPAARLPARHPAADGADMDHLADCWDREGMVDEAGAIVYGWLRAGGTRGSVLAALGSALLAEDAAFHWYQTYEAAVRQSAAWPDGSEQQALVLAGAARFLAAHTPTRRELAQVVRIAARLRRGEALFEAAGE
jgi:nitrite reductase/ring-hydroxylating ferredoxin subunit